MYIYIYILCIYIYIYTMYIYILYTYIHNIYIYNYIIYIYIYVCTYMHNICTHMLLCSYISYLETRPLIRHGNETRCKAPREPVSPPVNRKGFLLQPRFRKCSTSSSIIFPIYHGITSNYLYKHMDLQVS